MRSILLDDGRRESNVSPVRYLRSGSGASGALRVGDTVPEIVGNLRYSRGSGAQGAAGWRLVPVHEPVFAQTNPGRAGCWRRTSGCEFQRPELLLHR